MIESSKTATARVYIVRVWEEANIHPSSPTTWRAWVLDPRSQERWGFSSPQSLLDFLRGRIVQNRQALERGSRM